MTARPSCHTLLIVNPAAGRGRTLKALPRVERALKEMGINFERTKTTCPGDATELARKAAARGFTRVISLGGDGTASETARGLIGTETELAIIPCGTGNDFARMLGIHGNVAKALSALNSGTTRRVDVGRFGPHTFLNTVGIGFDGMVTHRNKEITYLSGFASYMAAVLSILPTFKAPGFHLKARDWEFSGKGLLVELGNGRTCGGGFPLNPDADIEDGLLDITFLGNYGPIPRFVALPMVFARRMHWLKGVRFFRADILQITVDRPLFVHVDGNLERLSGPCVAEIMPKSLKVVFPN